MPIASEKILQRISLIGIGVGLFVVYMLWVTWRPAEVFWSLDEGGKFIYLQNVLRTGDPGAPIAYLGHFVDPDLQFVPLYFWKRTGDSILPWWPVGFPLLSLPFYRLFGWPGLYVLPALGGALTSVLTGMIVQKLKPLSGSLSLWAALITGLTTPVTFYSTVFWEHTLSTALCMGLVLSTVLAARTDNLKWLTVGGALGALSSFLRIEAGVIALGALAVVFLHRKSWAISFATALGITYLLLLALNWSLSGEPFSGQTGVLINTPFFSGLSHAGWLFLPSVLFNTSLVLAYPIPAWMLVGGSICVAAMVIGSWIKRARWVTACAFIGIVSLSAFVLFQSYGYRSVHGFILIAPAVVFAVWLYPLPKSNIQRVFSQVLVSSGAICGLAYVARGWLAAGGLQWGPRYLLPFYPLCIVAGLLALKGTPSLKRPFWCIIVGIYILSVLLGLGYQIRGAYSLWYTAHLFRRAWYQVESLEADAIVTPCTWMPMVIPSLYWERPIFAVHNQESLHQWSTLAAQKGLRVAYLVDMHICWHIALDEVEQHGDEGVVAYRFVPGELPNLPVQWR